MVYGVARTTEEINPGGSDRPIQVADHKGGDNHSESDTRESVDARGCPLERPCGHAVDLYPSTRLRTTPTTWVVARNPKVEGIILA